MSKPTESPFVSVQANETVYKLIVMSVTPQEHREACTAAGVAEAYTEAEPTTNRLAIHINKLKDPMLTFDTIEEVEQHFIDNAEVYEANLDAAIQDRSTVTEEDEAKGVVLQLLINRVANQIARKSYRGAGNVALMNERNRKFLAASPTSAFRFKESGETIGRWTNTGVLINTVEVWTSEELPDDTVVVAYWGNSMDGAVVRKFEDKYGAYDKQNDFDDHTTVIRLTQ